LQQPLFKMPIHKQLPDVTSTLLAGFSPYLERIFFDFCTNSIEFRLFDLIEQPTSLRVLRFERIQDLEITAHNADEIDPTFIDSIIGAHRQGAEFYFHSDRYAISFRSAVFHESIAFIIEDE
jgi:hypothetical protein